MTIKLTMQAAWGSLWALRGPREAPLWASLLLAAGLGAALALGLMSFAATFATVEYPNWWWASMLPNILICICIVFTLLGTLRLAAKVLPTALVERMSSVQDLAAGMGLSAIALCGISIGIAIGFTVVPPLLGFSAWAMFNSLPVALAKFAIFLLFVLAVNWAWWRSRLRQKELRREAAEAQLRLLQGQIEPHFLFNTLANVQGLMDVDVVRAKQMLEAFSDYLRAGLTQLRAVDTTLGAELDMAQTYLELMQIRMLDRLHFSIDAGPQARAASLPTLLLQPLVENAIHHGLEPKVEGGRIRIRASVAEGRLEVSVDDDGMGLDAPRRGLRGGTGMAVGNLRARLQTRYGEGASLTLAPQSQGTQATLDLPLGAPA
jgi:hypothetical protein